MTRYTLALVSLLCFACTQDPQVAPQSSGGSVPSAFEETPWKPLATFKDPAVSDAGAHARDVLLQVLQQHGIATDVAPNALGSAEFTLRVGPDDLSRARTVVTGVIAREGLDATLVKE